MAGKREADVLDALLMRPADSVLQCRVAEIRELEAHIGRALAPGCVPVGPRATVSNDGIVITEEPALPGPSVSIAPVPDRLNTRIGSWA